MTASTTSDPLFSVENQVTIVSGGSRGIGRAIAAGFAERGANVMITGREQTTIDQTSNEIGGDGRSVRGVVCDVTKATDIDSLVKTAVAEYGKIDTLINVAGVNRRKPAIDVTADDYDFIVDINVKGAFLLSQAIGRQMIEQGGGSQINVASLNTDRPLKNVLPYAMSKSAMGHMTRGLALEWGPKNVRVNALAPGFILTDLTRKLWSDEKVQAWGKFNTPQGRLGVPEDMVGTAIFLATPASAFMTGQILYVDGGYTAGWAWPIPE